MLERLSRGWKATATHMLGPYISHDLPECLVRGHCLRWGQAAADQSSQQKGGVRTCGTMTSLGLWSHRSDHKNRPKNNNHERGTLSVRGPLELQGGCWCFVRSVVLDSSWMPANSPCVVKAVGSQHGGLGL